MMQRDSKGRFISGKPSPVTAPTAPSSQKRTDGWLNILTGLGSSNRDKRLSSMVQYERLSEGEAEELYAADDIAARLVDTMPEDATREWVDFNFKDPEDTKKLESESDRLQVTARAEQGWKWARLYGGAAILISTGEDDLSQPLGEILEVKSLVVLQRYELNPHTIDKDIASPNFGRPLLYNYFPAGYVADAKASHIIHHSRLIRFDGVKLPLRKEISNNYWGDSVLNRTRNAIRNYQTSHDAVATILQEFNQGVLKLSGLAELIGAGEDSVVMARLQAVNLGRSVCRSILLDSDNEEFSNVGAQVTGISDLLDHVGGRLVAASKQPRTLILGESPKGLNSSGQNERKDWYDHVSNQQDLVLRPAYQKIFECIFAAKKGPFKGRRPEDFAFEFRSLWQTDPKERAEIHELQSRADERYIANNVLSPDEVAISRFGHGKFSLETTIDHEERTMSEDTE